MSQTSPDTWWSQCVRAGFEQNTSAEYQAWKQWSEAKAEKATQDEDATTWQKEVELIKSMPLGLLTNPAGAAQFWALAQRTAKRLEEAMAAGGFCEKHTPTGGHRSCQVCGNIKLSYALDQIDYALGEPNPMELSDYMVHCNEDEVVKRVQEFVAKHKNCLRIGPTVVRPVYPITDES